MEFEERFAELAERQRVLISSLTKDAIRNYKNLFGVEPEIIVLDKEMLGRAIAQIETDS